MTSPSGRSRSTWEICASNQSKSRVERVLTFLPGSSRRSQAIPSSKASAPDGAPAWTFCVRLGMGALASMTLMRAIVGIYAAVCQEKRGTGCRPTLPELRQGLLRVLEAGIELQRRLVLGPGLGLVPLLLVNLPEAEVGVGERRALWAGSVAQVALEALLGAVQPLAGEGRGPADLVEGVVVVGRRLEEGVEGVEGGGPFLLLLVEQSEAEAGTRFGGCLLDRRLELALRPGGVFLVEGDGGGRDMAADGVPLPDLGRLLPRLVDAAAHDARRLEVELDQAVSSVEAVGIEGNRLLPCDPGLLGQARLPEDAGFHGGPPIGAAQPQEEVRAAGRQRRRLLQPLGRRLALPQGEPSSSEIKSRLGVPGVLRGVGLEELLRLLVAPPLVELDPGRQGVRGRMDRGREQERRDPQSLQKRPSFHPHSPSKMPLYLRKEPPGALGRLGVLQALHD